MIAASLEPAHVEALRTLRASVRAVVRGKDRVVDLAITTVLAGGHLLLQDIPGVGKTTLAAALAEALGGSFSRVQFTADLLPSDITGVSVLAAGGGGRLWEASGPLNQSCSHNNIIYYNVI